MTRFVENTLKDLKQNCYRLLVADDIVELASLMAAPRKLARKES